MRAATSGVASPVDAAPFGRQRAAHAAGHRATSPTTPTSTPVRRPALGVEVDLGHHGTAGIRRPCRVVHMFSVLPQATTRSAAAISSAVSGVAKPPEMSRYQGSPANSPFAAADTASSAPHRSASGDTAARADRVGAPPGDEHRSPGRAQRVDERASRSGAARRRGRHRPRRAGQRPRPPRAWTSSGSPSTTVRPAARSRSRRRPRRPTACPAAYPR